MKREVFLRIKKPENILTTIGTVMATLGNAAADNWDIAKGPGAFANLASMIKYMPQLAISSFQEIRLPMETSSIPTLLENTGHLFLTHFTPSQMATAGMAVSAIALFCTATSLEMDRKNKAEQKT